MPRPGDDQGSLAFLLLVILVGLGLSSLLVPMIISQDRATRFATTRVQALDAAQAGLDVTLGLIRSATTVGVGDSGKLPCASAAAPLTGTVNSTGVAAYSVVIEYFTFDPTKEAYPSPNAMKCASGYGTYDTATGVITPSFARITSTGTDGTAVNGVTSGRTVVSNYVFKTSNVNIAGGVVRVFDPGTLCLDAGSATPIAATAVVLQACSSTVPALAQQVFAYRSDLTLQLLSSVTTTYPNGLCLDTAGSAQGNAVVLNVCRALGSPTYTEQWSYDDWGRYQASLLTSAADGGLSGLCMQPAAKTAGQGIALASCINDTTQAWNPSAAVGAGAAGLPQWINYAEFGRCLDVNAQNINSDHLIDYPCKQNPYAGAVAWNQKFTAPTIPSTTTNVVGTMYTMSGWSSYCLTSPGVNGAYVTMGVVAGAAVPCSGLSSQTWTFYGGGAALPYSTKYTIVDNKGLCLGWTTPNGAETWSAIDVETCTGALDQKWNADPNVLSATLQNTREK